MLIVGDSADDVTPVVVTAGPDDRGRFDVATQPSGSPLIVPGSKLFSTVEVEPGTTERRFLAVGKGYYSEVRSKRSTGPAPGGTCGHCGHRIGRGMPRCKVVEQENAGFGWHGVQTGTDSAGNGKGLYFCGDCRPAITFPEETAELFTLKGSS